MRIFTFVRIGIQHALAHVVMLDKKCGWQVTLVQDVIFEHVRAHCLWKTMENPMDFLPGSHHDSMANLLLENNGKQMMGTWVNPFEPKDWVNMDK